MVNLPFFVSKWHDGSDFVGDGRGCQSALKFDGRAHCLTQNVAGQFPADYGGITEFGVGVVDGGKVSKGARREVVSA